MREIKKDSGRALAIAADLAQATDIDTMVARTLEEFGRLDVLHNNAYGALATTRRQPTVRLRISHESVGITPSRSSHCGHAGNQAHCPGDAETRRRRDR